jgi:hypothetical protein
MKKLVVLLLFFSFFHKSESQVNGAPYCLAPTWTTCYDSITPFDTVIKYNVYYGSSMIGVQNTFYSLVNSLPHWIKYLSGSTVNPANLIASTTATVTATDSSHSKQMGLNKTITLKYSGAISITITGILSQEVASNGGIVQISYGTGTAPINGAAATGTAVGTILTLPVIATPVGFSLTYNVSGLTIGTAYWIDLRYAVDGGGALTPSSISLNAAEIK